MDTKRNKKRGEPDSGSQLTFNNSVKLGKFAIGVHDKSQHSLATPYEDKPGLQQKNQCYICVEFVIQSLQTARSAQTRS